MTKLSSPASKFARPALTLVLAAVLLPLSPAAYSQKADGAPAVENESFEPRSGQAGKDVIWVPTPMEIVEAMLDMAEVKAGDKLVDLGAGDGRIAIAAAKRGADATGIEFNPDMVALSKRNAARAGVSNARFIQGDIFQSDFSDADVVTMYLLPVLNERLRPQLLDMKPGTRVSSHQFTMGNWKPDARRSVAGHEALFWVVPAKVGGTWQVKPSAEGANGELRVEFKQDYQELEGRARWGSSEAAVSDVKLVGGNLRFSVADGRGGVHRFVATAGHDGRMTGTMTDAGGKEQPFTAARINSVGSL
jgi:SAM-dependent methyltransferase